MDSYNEYVLSIIKSTVLLSESDEFRTIEEEFNSIINDVSWLVREKYHELAVNRGNEIKSDLHDEAVQAQGGL